MHHAKSKVSGIIHKGFKAEKCKVSLRMAMSRMKLLRNKREVQVRQMRRDVAQLLQSGQDQTARIRVEHVIREEKTMAAYELLELYCELIVARLAIIDSQKTCPIDLQEAISSVIFASPRCADVQELMDVCKQFLSKYGKEFTTAALELRPDCCVSHMIIEKLSAKAPDTETKIKTLKSIAEEHGIEWDSKALLDELQKPKNDLLTGSTQYTGASQVAMNHSANSSVNTSTQPKPTQFLSSSQVAMGYPDTNSSAGIHQISYEPKPTQFLSSSEVTVGHSDFSSSTKTSAGPTSFAQPKNEDTIESDDSEPPDDQVPPRGGILSSTGSIIYPPPPPPFMRYEESAPSSTQPEFSSPDDTSRQEKTEHKYKDAKEAARAAAESAERAQMAAKAAADLARHENKAHGKEQVEEDTYIPDAGSVEDAHKEDFQSDEEEEEEDVSTHPTGPGRENEYVWDTHEPSSVAVFDQGDSDIDEHSTNLLDTFSQPKKEDFTSSDYYWGKQADNRKQDIGSIFFEGNTKESSPPRFASSSAPAFDSDDVNSENEAEQDMEGNEGKPRYIYDEEKKEKEAAAFPSSMKNRVSSDNNNEEAELGLKFGKLTGGLRNKGYGRPPFVKKSITDATPSVESFDNHDVYYSSRTKNPLASDVHEAEVSYVVSVESEKNPRGRQKFVSRSDTDYEVEEPENQQVQDIARHVNKNIIKQSRGTRDAMNSANTKDDNIHFGKNQNGESSDEETANESVVAEKPDEVLMKSSVPPSTSVRPRRPPDYESLAAHFRSLRTNRP